jgi:hypothetical protein
MLAIALLLPALVFGGNLTLRVEGRADAATFDGAANLSSFASSGDGLVGVATLSGALRDAEGERVASAENTVVRLPVARGSLRASCDQLAMSLGPSEVTVGDRRVRLETIELEVPARAGGPALRDLLCGLERSLRAGAPTPEIARTLDAVLATLG